MPRRSLRPELNRIRGWVRQGRTDAWIAHQLEVTVQQIQTFKREQALEPDADPETTAVVADFDDEIDLRAVDDAMIAAELDAEAAAAAAEAAAAQAAAAARAEAEQDDDDDRPKRRRGRRGGRSARGKRQAGGPWEATFDHGEEGIGLWLDPAVQDDPVYAESWAGHRPVEVTIEEDRIVIRRAGVEEADDGESAAQSDAAPVEPESAAVESDSAVEAVTDASDGDDDASEGDGDAPEADDDAPEAEDAADGEGEPEDDAELD